MTEKSEQLQQELADVDAQIATMRSSVDELRAQVGGQGDGAQDAEDVAAALNNIEELEAVLSALDQRRESVLRKIAEDDQS
jgi:SMC interacting uncharacterized protein involved in chromosome segregation